MNFIILVVGENKMYIVDTATYTSSYFICEVCVNKYFENIHAYQPEHSNQSDESYDPREK